MNCYIITVLANMIEKVRHLNVWPSFNMASIKTKGVALIIEHAPCCILSVAAGLIGVSSLNHNPVLELGFAVGGAITGEYLGHKYFFKNCQHDSVSDKIAVIKRYGIALSFGLLTWGAHQIIFHDHGHHHGHSHYEETEQQMPACNGRDQYLVYLDEEADEAKKAHGHSHGPVCAFR